MSKTPFVCNGQVSHGTGCGICLKCEKEIDKLRENSPVSVLVNEKILKLWAEAAEEPDLKEIVRLAGVGLWSERHSQAIEDALNAQLASLPISKISRFEKAMDAYRKLKR